MNDREILFRAKRIDNKELCYGQIIEDNGQCFIVPKFGMLSIDKPSGNTQEELVTLRAFEVYPETICQYVGLSDKNGKPIFEGDICKRTLLPTKRITDNFRIAYVSAKCCFSAIDLDGSNVTFISDYINSSYEVEVIGNVYDNPELLKGDNRNEHD